MENKDQSSPRKSLSFESEELPIVVVKPKDSTKAAKLHEDYYYGLEKVTLL